MKLEFQIEDSEGVVRMDGELRAVISLTKANARLQEMLAECPVVYGLPGKRSGEAMLWSKNNLAADSHTAKLVCVEELASSKPGGKR